MLNPSVPKSMPPHALSALSNDILHDSILALLVAMEIVYADSDEADLQLLKLQPVIVVLDDESK